MDARNRAPARWSRAGILVGIAAACAPVATTGPAPPTASPHGFPTVIGPVAEGVDRIGAEAPGLEGVSWLDGKEHATSDWRGKVLLVRWWTDRCAYCVHTAPALRALETKHGEDLVVLAIFHPKPGPRPVLLDEVRASAARLGLAAGEQESEARFLVGVDADWVALRRWWLGVPRTLTSVTFLIDRAGRIRLIHSGGEFHTQEQVSAQECARDPALCAADEAAMDAAIEVLKREPAPVERTR